MRRSNYSIKDFNIGEERVIADIFNNAMKTIAPSIISLKAEDFREIYKKNPLFKPDLIKFLSNAQNQIIGYGECRDYGDIKYLDYPLILSEKRTSELDKFLFSVMFENIQSIFPHCSIASHSYPVDYEGIHTFFLEQEIAKVKGIQDTLIFTIQVENLNFEAKEYEIKPFTRDDIETLVKFRNSEGDIEGNLVTHKTLLESFRTGKYSPENSFMIYYEDSLVAWKSTMISTPIHEAYTRKDLKHSIGIIDGFITNYDHEDRLELEKAALKTSYNYLKKNNIMEYREGVRKSGEYHGLCNELGLEDTGEVERGYLLKV